MHARLFRSALVRARLSLPLPLAAIRRSLERAERLVPAPPPPPVPRARPVPRPPPAPAPPRPSAWDPEPASPALVRRRRGADEEALVLQEINGCKTLLLEIIRRAAYDWVLYRTSRKLVNKVLADQAYQWLFKETDGTADWAARQREGKYITSFVAICESLDLDPDAVRTHIKRLTPKNVTSVGRPAEYRRRDVFPAHASEDDAFGLPGLPGHISQYEVAAEHDFGL